MIGEHAVTIYADRSAADWSPPVADNAYFTDSIAGWATMPFADALAWNGGAVVSTLSPSHVELARAAAAGVLLPGVEVDTWRVRVAISWTGGPASTLVTYGVQVGITATDANEGPFWNTGGEARELKTFAGRAPGKYVLEATFPSSPEFVAGMGYVSPFVKIGNGGAATKVTGLRIDSLELSYRGGDSADLSCWVDAVSIQHGREDSSGQPEAAAATLDIAVNSWTGPLPVLVDIGAVITITTQLADYTSTRFTGRITDVALGWDDAGEGTPNEGVGQVVAVATMADLARRVIGDTPWPQELDGARVLRVLEAADMPPDPMWSDPGTVQILPRDVDSKAALEVAQETAQSANGTVWHTRAGDVRYADSEHRRGGDVAMDLDACDVLVTPTWQRNLEGLVNQVSIGYGPTPEEGEQPRYVAEDPDSIARFGRYGYTIATELAALADATAAGQLLLVRNSDPVWILGKLPLDVKGLSDDQTRDLLELDMHSLIRLSGLPAIGSAPTSVALWVEGWTEKLGWGEHELELNASGYCRSAPPPRWNDLSPATTWDSMDALLEWDQMACLGPPTNTGRWDDVPASTRWNGVPPSVTWDTYTPGRD